jgi:hypothetical protein
MPSYPGRPREFTYQRRREMLDHVGQGATLEEAARIVGVSLRTVQREARHNDHFDHDLQLAVHAAPVDPEKLVARAARTHWRAAAWLLERTDPDRFARRPPNSCSPETLREFGAWLIETALEATPPEHRGAMYRRMSAVADQAYDVVMPDQHDARRSLVGALPHRPMPLSDHEVAKELLAVDKRPAPALGLAEGGVRALPAAPAMGDVGAESPRATPVAVPSAVVRAAMSLVKPIADPVAYYRRHPLPDPPAGRPRESVDGFRLQDSESMDAEWRYPLPDEVELDAASNSVTPADQSAPPAPNSAAAPCAASVSNAANQVAGVESASPQSRPLGATQTPTPATPLGSAAGRCPAESPERGNYVAKNVRGDTRVPCPRPRGPAAHGDENNAMARLT